MAHTVAIVEDDQAIREMYQIKFEAEGYKVYVAANGREGLDLAEKVKPDLILLDLMMPEMTGDEMLKALRSTDWGKNIKVIILTNVSKDEAYPLVNPLGVEGFVVKAHYTPQEVVETVGKTLTLPAQK
jgi:DNA-binding response OmpR family regulator